MKKMLGKLGLILLLTFLFIFDDILFYLLLKNIYSWEIGYLAFASGAAIVLLLNVGLALAVFRIMRRQPTTGREGMIGQVGVVLKKESGAYLVRVRGEIWKSESATRLSVGEKVIVENVDGLSLSIKKC